MSGWSLVYNLINFAILAGALYLIGRKLVAKAFQTHRDTIESDLEKSAASLNNVENLRVELEEAKSSGEKERAGILADAEALAADNSRKSELEDAATADHLAA